MTALKDTRAWRVSRSLLLFIALFGSAGCDAGRSPAVDGGGAGSQPGESSTETWRVVATSAGARKILAIKEIRSLTGLGLREAKDLADETPSVIVTGASRVDAASAADRLRVAGMTVELESE